MRELTIIGDDWAEGGNAKSSSKESSWFWADYLGGRWWTAVVFLVVLYEAVDYSLWAEIYRFGSSSMLPPVAYGP